jgi:hypothetical protein
MLPSYRGTCSLTAEYFSLPRNISFYPGKFQNAYSCAFPEHLRKPSRRLTTQSTATRSIDRPSVRAIDRAIERSSDRSSDRAMKRTGLVFLLFLDGLLWMLCFALAFWRIRLCIWLICLCFFSVQATGLGSSSTAPGPGRQWAYPCPESKRRCESQHIAKVSILQKSAYFNLHGCCLKPGAFAKM